MNDKALLECKNVTIYIHNLNSIEVKLEQSKLGCTVLATGNVHCTRTWQCHFRMST